VPDPAQIFDLTDLERQLHHRAERGLGRTTRRKDELMVLTRIGAEKDERVAKDGTLAAVGDAKAKELREKRDHAFQVNNIEPEVR
jgi:hypothetical protein